MQTKQTSNWAAFFVLLWIGLSVAFLALLALVLVLTSLFDLFNEQTDTAVISMISAFSFSFLLLALLACGWFVLGKVRRQPAADELMHIQFPRWMWALLPVAVVAIIGGGLISLLELTWLNWLVLPVFSVLGIVVPILLLFGIAAWGIEVGSRWHFFSIFSLSMTIAPLIMIVIEVTALIVVIVAGLVYASSTDPTLLSELQALGDLFDQTSDEQVLLTALTPYMTNPTVIAVALGFIAVLVPLVEELFKPLAVWLFGRSLKTPAQGFALGAVSGAGFALLESLNASADGTTTWAVIVTARAGTSLLHILTSGLVGWGIASAFSERRIGRLLAAYVSAVLIHGIWNAAAIGTGIAFMGEGIGQPDWVFKYAPALVGGLIVLVIGMLVVLFAANRKLRTPPNLTQPAEEKVESGA